MTSLVDRFRGLLGRGGSTFAPGLALEQVPFVVVDTELTGLDPKRDSVVSVGAVRMSGTRIELGQSLYRLVSPQAGFKRESIVIHGITPDDVAEQPPLAGVAAELVAFCGERIVVGHFLSIDLAFLGRESEAVRAADWRGRAVDTMRLHLFAEQHRHRHGGGISASDTELGLEALARRHGIPASGAHNALADAFVTAQLLQRQLRSLPELGVRTIGDLLRVGRP